eukprot:CAMPEP_0119003558 /NCGR_PEP_ID=MMETSP1176-20130426/630_1 /TAXON_ID=265551 /ORGANISM="Synedropsis recta cf, Strain CCMP1620" /LENGTH=584 /DNA_ID=CAMNT_0006955171 /DNA_START=140 /DNA_END=1894 /DNA_ORIENTATION=+
MSSDSSDDDDDDVSMQSSEDDEEEEEEEVAAVTVTHAEHKQHGNASYQQKDYRTATGHYTLAIETAKQELESIIAAAATATTATTTTAADKATEKATDLATKLASYYGNRAAAFTMLLNYDDAINDCDAAIAVDSKFIKAHFRKAKVLCTVGRLDEALKAYSYGLIHDPNHAVAIQERTQVQTIQKRFLLAKELLAKMDASSSTQHHNQHHARQALSQIQLVLAACPSYHDATLVKIDALSRMTSSPARMDEAYALSTKLMTTSDGYETNNDLIYIRANCLFHQGNLEGTKNHLRMILASDPDNKKSFAMIKLVRALVKKKDDADQAYKQNDFATAVTCYGQALDDLCPKQNTVYTSKLHFNRAMAHHGLRNHAACVADCTTAIRLNSDYQKAYMRRAASQLLLGAKEDCQGAIRDYDQAERLANTPEEIKDIRKKSKSAKIQLSRAGKKDLYKLLDLSRDATESDIKKAYRKMALKHHPDRQKGSEEEKKLAEATFREINLANEILSDPQKKRRYDEGVDEQDIDDPHAQPGGGHGHSHGGHGGGMGGMDQDMLFEMFMRQQQQSRRGGARGAGGSHFGSPFG